jgi:RNA polymerase sigma-B factor
VSSGGERRSARARRTAELLAGARAAGPRRRAELLDRVVEINLPVAESIARRYRNRGVDLADLYQAAYEGLVTAVHRYDAGRADDLLTYAVPTIRGTVTRHFRDRGWIVRPPRPIQELQGRIPRTTDRLRADLGREPGPDDVADALGVGRGQLDEARLAYGSFRPQSLDVPVGEGESDGMTLGEVVAVDEDDPDPVEARLVLAPVVRRLDERERRILYLRYFEDRTQKEIGDEIGVTQMQVSRLLSGILARLRTEIEAA